MGRLYTEYGPVNLQARLDRYLANPDAGPADAIALQRDFGVLQLYREEPLYNGPRLAHIEAIVSRCLAAGRRDAVRRIRP